MKYTGMIFNDEMVRAILDGRKTQTRRPVAKKFNAWEWDVDKEDKSYGPFMSDEYGDWHDVKKFCPFGQPGDRLWVRETWTDDFMLNPAEQDKSKIAYKADGEKLFPMMKWKPSIHMPRWASRITLEIVRVWVERVQEISDSDAYAEGTDYWCGNFLDKTGGSKFKDILSGFTTMWDSIYGKGPYSWVANPWVWGLEFKQVTQ